MEVERKKRCKNLLKFVENNKAVIGCGDKNWKAATIDQGDKF